MFDNFDTETTVRKALAESGVLAKSYSPYVASDLADSVSAALDAELEPIREAILSLASRIDAVQNQRDR